MAYTNNTPQATQTIAFTQPLIQDNFGFIKTGIEQEHNFNAPGTGSDMYHLKASMPNQADPGALPAGTNGQYYVSGGIAKFYNGTAFQIQLTNVPLKVLTGTVALNTTFANVNTIPANAVGNYWIFLKGSALAACAAGQLITTTTDMYISGTSVLGQDPGMSLTNSGLTFRAKVDSSSNNGVYTYLITYSTP